MAQERRSELTRIAIGKVKLGEVSLEEVKIDFGVIDLKSTINALLGLDSLMKLGVVIDLRRLSLTLDA